MKFLVNPSHPLHKYLSQAVDLYLLNILFLITSGFGLFLGPALTALYSVHFAVLTDYRERSLIIEYFRAYKRNFKRGMTLQLILVAAGICLFISYRCTRLMTGSAGILVQPGLIIITIILTVMLILVFPYTARYKNGLGKTFKVCLQVAALNLKKTLLLLVLPGAILITAIQSNFLLTALLILLIFVGFSAMTAISAKIILPVFKQYE